MSFDTKMTALANAIRNKSGRTDTLTLDEMTVAVQSIEVGGGGGNSDLPAGYTRCDYIQFDGTQIVDTGIICNQDTKLQVCFTRERSTQHYLLGVASLDNTASVTAYLGGSWRFGNKYTTKTINSVRGDMVYTGIVSGSEISANNGVYVISGVNAFETVGSLLLGTCRGSDGSLGNPQFQGKVPLLALWQGETQVQKLIPVTDGNGIYRFWDTIGKKFHDSITDTALGGGNF